MTRPSLVWGLALASLCLILSHLTSLAQVTEGKKGEFVVDPRYGEDRGIRKEGIIRRKWLKLRDDLLVHAESACLVDYRTGNVSLLSASRYGLGERFEISTYLVEDVIRPTVYGKYLINVINKKWFISTRFDIANAYPGMAIAKKKEVERVIQPDAKIPFVLEVGDEMLVSRAWYTDPNCSDNSKYLIVTGGIGLYWGILCSKGDSIQQSRFHFLANRSETLVDKGFRSRFKVWVDGRLTNRLYAHGGIYYHFGLFDHHHAVELQAEAEYFFNEKIAAKLGFLTSFANYVNIDKHAAIWPIVDVTFYFGNRNKPRDSTLFGPSRRYRRHAKDIKMDLF